MSIVIPAAGVGAWVRCGGSWMLNGASSTRGGAVRGGRFTSVVLIAVLVVGAEA
ncbi:hypothetical protein [Mumia sp. DW29H23]|uniref:hypothetical protein n=1 Tax=Mumia sp. DW29H23 TaxID=3421241 RepID=UPI003D6927E1